ncbi:MAG: hypothetical protein KGM42_11390 [Hyphomicrobiales bacterium]|nr:hypothetical protein [Hyphomicrobiales bacterium]
MIAGPDPTTKTPAFKAPAGAVDSQAHIFGPQSDRPHPKAPVMSNDGDLNDLIPHYAPDETQRQKLLVDNPARLFRV